MIKNVLDAFTERLETLPQLKYVAEDCGQLDYPELFPALEWPCALVDLDKVDYSDRGKKMQEGAGLVMVRLAVPGAEGTNAATLYELSEKIYTALQGLAGEAFSGTTRRQVVKVARNRQTRELLHLFRVNLTDISAMVETRTITAKPVFEIE